MTSIATGYNIGDVHNRDAQASEAVIQGKSQHLAPFLYKQNSYTAESKQTQKCTEVEHCP